MRWPVSSLWLVVEPVSQGSRVLAVYLNRQLSYDGLHGRGRQGSGGRRGGAGGRVRAAVVQEQLLVLEGPATQNWYGAVTSSVSLPWRWWTGTVSTGWRAPMWAAGDGGPRLIIGAPAYGDRFPGGGRNRGRRQGDRDGSAAGTVPEPLRHPLPAHLAGGCSPKGRAG